MQLRRYAAIAGSIAVLLALSGSTGASAAPLDSAELARKLDEAVSSAMSRTGAKGLAMAVVDNGRPIMVKSWGARNPKGDALETDTIMYGASLTKAVFGYTVMQLVDEGRIDLDRPISAYLPRPLPEYGNLDAYGNWGDLAGNDRWRKLTPRILLTHGSGFANYAFLEPDRKLRFHFDPGRRYAYSGEGIILLQFVIEKGLGLDLGAEMKRRVFDRFGMKDSSMTWRADFAAHLADGWTDQGKALPHDERSRVRASGSLDTTIADFARFAAGFMRGEGISRRARAEMIRPQLPITTKSQFMPLQAELPPARRRKDLSAGLGVVTFRGPQGRGFYKGGHDDQTGNVWVCVERGRRCVVILANDVRAEAAFPALVRAAIGETGAPWEWEYGFAPTAPS
jgi:CubicO group peptidase (beta-lactamase class C family)